MDFNSFLHAYNKILIDRATANTTVRNSNNTAQGDSPPPAYSSVTAQRPPPAVSQAHAANSDDEDLYADVDSDDAASTTSAEADDEDEETGQAQNIAIDASTVIHGSNNIIAFPPVDGPRLTAILLSLLNGNLPVQHQHQHQSQQVAAAAMAAAHHQRHQHQQQQQAPCPAPLPFPHPHLHAPHAQLPPAGLFPATTAAGRRRQHNRPVNIRINCGVRVVGDRNVLGGVGGLQQQQQPQQQQQQQQQGLHQAYAYRPTAVPRPGVPGTHNGSGTSTPLSPLTTPTMETGAAVQQGAGAAKRKAEGDPDALNGTPPAKKERADFDVSGSGDLRGPEQARR